jgi:transglutaminase-like putative cysteine protease
MMSASTRLTVAAALATFLGALPLSGSFSDWGWLGHTVGAIALIAAVGLALRAVRAPAWAVVVGQLIALLLFATAAFASAEALGGIIPSLGSFEQFRVLANDGLDDIQYLAAPIPPSTEMIAMTAIGVGVIAIVVDFVAAGLRRPAIAGLALLALFAVATSVTNGVPWIEFGMAAAGYLVLLAVEERERLLAWGRVITAHDSASGPAFAAPAPAGATVRQRPRYATASRIGVVTLAVALIVPAAVPGLSRNLLAKVGAGADGVGNGDNGTTGDSLSPFTRLKGSLTESATTTLFTVTSTVDNPYYLRTIVLDQYTPAGWRASGDDDDTTRIGPGLPLGPQVQQLQSQGQTRQVSSVITIGQYSDSYLPIYYSASSVSSPPSSSGTRRSSSWQYDAELGEVSSSRLTTSPGEQYTVTAVEPKPSQAALSAAAPVAANDPIMKRWGDLPAINSKVLQITQDAVGDATTPWAKSVALYNYFTDGRNGFQYSLQTAGGSSNDALLDFLTNKQGFCEQYASAMAAMLRIEGIPSRVVLGYTSGTYDAASKTWTVTNLDAHAWVEGYFTGIGWVEFDPTPLGDGRTQYEPYLPAPTTTPNEQPTEDQPTADSSTDVEQAPESSSDLITTLPTTDDTSSGSAISASTAIAIAIAVVVIALLLIPAATRAAARRRRSALARGPDPGLAAHAAWDEMTATAIDRGVQLPATDSTRALARRLLAVPSLDEPAKSAITLIADAEERSVYARHAGVEGDLAAALRTARHGLLSGLSRGRRCWIALAPRSVLAGAGRGQSRLALRYTQTRDRLAAAARGLLPSNR